MFSHYLFTRAENDNFANQKNMASETGLYNRKNSFHPSFRLTPIVGATIKDKPRVPFISLESFSLEKKRTEKDELFSLESIKSSTILTDWLPEQLTALEHLSKYKNLLIIGGPGTRKTDTLIKLKSVLTKCDVKSVLLASTSDVAINLNCQTLSGYVNGSSLYQKVEDLIRITKKKSEREKWSEPAVFFIDNVQLIEPDHLHLLHLILCNVRRNKLPFGGANMVFAGDLAQVMNYSESKTFKRMFFEEDYWLNGNFETICLHKDYRPGQDPRLSALLHRIRTGTITDHDRKTLAASVAKSSSPPTIKIYTEIHRLGSAYAEVKFNAIFYPPNLYYVAIRASEENDKLALTIQPSIDKCVSFKAKFILPHSFDPDMSEKSEAFLRKMRGGPVNETLTLFTGAQVMITIDYRIPMSDDSKRSMDDIFIKKGSIGIIVGWGEDSVASADGTMCKYPKVHFADQSSSVMIKPHTWEDYITKAQYKQLPLSLAWSLTTHNAPDLILNSAFIITKNIIDSRQFYGCLSKLKSMDGIILQSFNPEWLVLDPKIADLYRRCMPLKEYVKV